MSELLEAFLDEVGASADEFTAFARAALVDPDDAVRSSDDAAAFRRVAQMIREAPDSQAALDAVVSVVASCVEGTAHSVLVILDNGSRAADTGTVTLVDDATGASLVGTGAYHELLFDHLARHR